MAEDFSDLESAVQALADLQDAAQALADLDLDEIRTAIRQELLDEIHEGLDDAIAGATTGSAVGTGSEWGRDEVKGLESFKQYLEENISA